MKMTINGILLALLFVLLAACERDPVEEAYAHLTSWDINPSKVGAGR